MVLSIRKQKEKNSTRKEIPSSYQHNDKVLFCGPLNLKMKLMSLKQFKKKKNCFGVIMAIVDGGTSLKSVGALIFVRNGLNYFFSNSSLV